MINAHVISIRPKVVVDEVEHDRDAVSMGGGNERATDKPDG